jgi:hypothetical protein
VGPRSSLYGCRKSRLHQDWSLDRPDHTDYWLCCPSPYDKTITQLYDEKGVLALTFTVAITTYLDSFNETCRKSKVLCDISLLYIKISKQNLSHFPSCKTVLLSCTSPGDCLTLAANYNSIIQGLQNEFCSTFGDFHKRTQEIQMFQNPFFHWHWSGSSEGTNRVNELQIKYIFYHVTCKVCYAILLQISKQTFTSLLGTPTLRNPTKYCNDFLHIPIYWIEVNTFLQ